jgi:hypothetical protein
MTFYLRRLQDRTEPEEQKPEAVYYRGERPSGFLSRCVAILAAMTLALTLAHVQIVLMSQDPWSPSLVFSMSAECACAAITRQRLESFEA